MSGAAGLASAAAYRAGAGLVTVASTPPVLDVVRQRVPEATFLRLPETDDGAVDAAGWDALRERLDGADALAVGPGLGRHESTQELGAPGGPRLARAAGAGRGRPRTRSRATPARSPNARPMRSSPRTRASSRA